MDKNYDPDKSEIDIYKFWEKKGYFTPKIKEGEAPFCVLLPPPNANDPLHLGHALFVVEDILCRWHRMMGDPTLFLPGTDHAGIETQFVFEKKLQEKGKSRFDFERSKLYEMIEEYVEENRGIAKKQLKRLGFSLDWSRERYSLDPEALDIVFETFRKLHKDGLIYRGKRIVNYCPHCGTAFSDLEVEYIERKDFLYYLDYGSITIATTRPETIFADVAVAVNPKDKRYKGLVGKKAVLPILNKKLPIIADDLVEKEFGTGALKITPGHDKTDFEIGEKHGLPVKKVINIKGKMINVPEKYTGMKVLEARKEVLKELEEKDKLVKKKKIEHAVGTCYRCDNLIEPLTMPQWYVKIKPLAEKAMQVVKKGEVKFIPKRFEKLFFNWMENIEDWNISRQIVWGPRIPAWYCLDCNQEIIVSYINDKGEKITQRFKKVKDDFKIVKKGLQSLTAPVDAKYILQNVEACPKCGGKKILQETDTFDTWFSSGQWPLTTLRFPDSEDFEYFYPTSVLDTMWDILFFWVARMIMLCTYRAEKVPFKLSHMHSRVVDEKGQKMSKSRGNVINPMQMVNKYGADALRMALIYGVAPASDVSLGEKKIEAMRNFCNKIWNATRFLMFYVPEGLEYKKPEQVKHEDDQWILSELNRTIKEVNSDLDKYRFGQALEKIYQFFWHGFCDEYIEKVKDRKEETMPILLYVLITSLKLIHPFAPYVSEQIFQILKDEKNIQGLEEAIIIESWPK